MNAHRHVPEDGTKYKTPTAWRSSRIGVYAPSMKEVATCSRCGHHIELVPAARDRMAYWRIAR